jgi:hypothetical protein
VVRIALDISDMKLAKLESEACLRNAAQQFLTDSGYVAQYQNYMVPPPKPNVHLWDSIRYRKFGDWLFDQGAVLTKVDGRCHLEFFNESDMTLFVLKWS